MTCSRVVRGRACGRRGVRLSWGVCSFVRCSWHRAEFRRAIRWTHRYQEGYSAFHAHRGRDAPKDDLGYLFLLPHALRHGEEAI